MYIEIKNLKKSYGMGESKFLVINDLDMSVEKGKICAILGASGSGKSTLLNLISGLDHADSGSIVIDGKDISEYSESQLALYRREYVGYIFQFYNLIPDLTVRENILSGKYLAKEDMDTDELITMLGLTQHKDKFPSQLSGGQQQRCSIGRAVIKVPKILFCDEPTGALDYESSKEVLKILDEINRKYNMTILIVTHNEAICQMCDQVVAVRDGKKLKEYYNEKRKDISEIEW